jgi:site-specific recombinase XerD
MAGSRHATLYPRDGVWYVSYYGPGGVRKHASTGTPNRKLAEEIRRKFEREMYDGSEGVEREVLRALHDPLRRDAVLAAMKTGKPISVEDGMKEYGNYCVPYKSEKTLYHDTRQIEATFAALGVKQLHEVTTKQLNEFVSQQVKRAQERNDKDAKSRRQGWGPASVVRWRESLHHYFGWALKCQYVTTNPVDGVPRPSIPQKDIIYLNPGEIAKAIKAVTGDIVGAMIPTAIFAGPRRQELLWLTTNGDVDLERRLIHIRAKCIEGKWWFPKQKRNRVIPISAQLLPFLQQQQLKAGSGLWFFPSPEGTRWDGDNLSAHVRELMKKAGLRANFLVLRHTFGSALAQKGLSFEKIASYMGNSAKVVAAHYARLCPEDGHAEVEFAVLEKQVETG